MNGHECVAFCEIDKYARQSYKAMYDTTNEEELHDITKWTDEHVRQFIRDRGHIDCICGGFPCQSFSIAGKRGGFDDTRGTLFFEIMRIASIVRPRYLFLENVKGLLNHDGGATFETILNILDEFGYDAEWQVLNSKNFGVPQNRERVFIIGHLRGASGRTVFPVGGTDGETNIPIKQVAHRKGFATNSRTYSPDGITGTLDTAGGGGRELHVAIQPVLTPDRINKRQNGRRFKEDGEPMFTLTAQDRHGIAIREATKKGYTVAEPGDSVNISFPDSETRRGRVGKQTANTLLTGEEQAVVLGGDNDDKNKERNTFEILQALQKEIGEKEIAKWRSRILDTFQQEEILRQDVYEKGLDIEQDEKKLERNQQSHECEVKNTTFDKQERMREMSINKEFRCSSHGRGSIQQFARELTSIMQKLSHETSQKKNLYRLRETTQGFGLLQQALYKIQEVWESSLHKKQGVRIRKLTEKECFRLQGFTDEQFYKAKNDGVSNSQLYKQAGNSVTVNVIDAIVRKFS